MVALWIKRACVFLKCAREHSWNVCVCVCACACVCVTEARQDKGENGLDPSEQIKDEPGESKALDVHG